jgi:hypothetical protein
MPATKPRGRPGTQLEGLDLLESKTYRKAPPLRYGTFGDLTWALYTRSGRGADYALYVLHKGELVTRRTLDVHPKLRRSHPVADLGEMYDRLWTLYARTREWETPLQDLQEYFRRQTRQKARKLHHEAKMQHWQSKWRVKTDHTGRGAHHQVVPQK